MTLRDYINDPSLGTSKNRLDLEKNKQKYEEIAKRMYSSKFILVKPYLLKNQFIIFCCKVKSESVSEKEFFYDVIIQLDISNAQDILNIMDCPCTVFSNCPSFVFKYANVFYHKKLLISWTSKLYDKETYKISPDHTNSDKVIDCEKSLYSSAYIISKLYGQYTKERIIGIIPGIQNYLDILRNTKRFDQIMELYHKSNEKSKNRSISSNKTDDRSSPKKTSLVSHGTKLTKPTVLRKNKGTKKTTHTSK